jgi:hypothetical protein
MLLLQQEYMSRINGDFWPPVSSRWKPAFGTAIKMVSMAFLALIPSQHLFLPVVCVGRTIGGQMTGIGRFASWS